jgi:hypothetical protein
LSIDSFVTLLINFIWIKTNDAPITAAAVGHPPPPPTPPPTPLPTPPPPWRSKNPPFPPPTPLLLPPLPPP